MPLLLASTFQHFKKIDVFQEQLSTWKVACITTAALAQIDDVVDRPDWVIGEIEAIETRAGEFFEYDLRGKNSDDLDRDLQSCDLIYFIGGNTFVLLEYLQKSNFQKFIVPFLAAGKSLWGGSAGAIINCPDIHYIACMDEPEKANLNSTKGLSLTSLSIIPHWKCGHHQEALECLSKNPDLDLICLTDDQAIYINDNCIEVL